MADDLLLADSWMPVTNTPVLVDLHHTVTNTVSGAGRFFRLRRMLNF
jgi:hypothetical protein